MLLGEHAVVYGHPCLVTAVGQRMRAIVSALDEAVFVLEAPDVQVTGYRKSIEEIGSGEVPKGARFVEMAVKNFSEKYPLAGGISIVTSSEFSSLFGFGSSSASTVCVLTALAELFGISLGKRDLFDLACKTVMDIQKKGSGFDIAAAIYGGTLSFVAGGKVIEPIALDVLPLVIGYTGIKADTVELINKVEAQMNAEPERIEKILSEIAQVVDRAMIALNARDWASLGSLMDRNQDLLRQLDVSSSKLDAMIEGARKGGAFGAKLSGAGVGDCMIAIVSDPLRLSVIRGIEEADGEVLDIPSNVEGVRIES